MVRYQASSRCLLLRDSDNPVRRKRQKLIWLALSYARFALLMSSSHYMKPKPYHTSKLSGREWVQELLDSHPQWIKDNLGVWKHVFQRLCVELAIHGGLKPTRHVDIPEHVGMFLWVLVTNLSIIHLTDKMQRSGSTISRSVTFICILSMLLL
jgi:hypothetical protein